MVAAATKMRTLVTDGYFEPDALSVSYAQSITNFNAGKAAMYPMGSWYLGSIPKNEWATSACSPGRPTTARWSSRSRWAARWRSARRPRTRRPPSSSPSRWSLNPDNLKSLISGDGAFPMLKGKPLASYGLTLSPAFNSSYSYVTNPNTKVSSMSWATNDDALPGN